MKDRGQRDAAEIRAEWLDWSHSTKPADRPAAEAAISGLYRLIGLRPPRFHWVQSPLSAAVTVPPGGRALLPERSPVPPLAGRLSQLAMAFTADVDARIPPAVVRYIDGEVSAPLTNSAVLFRTALLEAHEEEDRRLTAWYNTLTFPWTAVFDAYRRVAGCGFDHEQLDLWISAFRSCGGWWPDEHVCLVSERPVAVHAEEAGRDGALRLHSATGPAIGYADGWGVYFWHGRLVPAWVVTDPCAARIRRERNVEVRRCAIENLGWAAYIEQARLRLLATAPDPGNPGSELRLYHWHQQSRVLLAVNGSLERDGTRRRYGLVVPPWVDDPVAAAAWTYGLTPDQYSLLARRT
ncbi:hypothetical protein J5X84_02030 [Streptosporangiaceae bacterium NEAU-GS5]|nr:hypothetical protein [Streptosporangiaceae bacterium NEAU-GS5]